MSCVRPPRGAFANPVRERIPTPRSSGPRQYRAVRGIYVKWNHRGGRDRLPSSARRKRLRDKKGDHFKIVRKEPIPDVVCALAATGAISRPLDIVDTGFGDADLDSEVARISAHAIAKSYGERDYLKCHIIKYLRSIAGLSTTANPMSVDALGGIFCPGADSRLA